MKIAMTAVGTDLNSRLDPRFGRAQYILIADPDGTIAEVIDNASNRAAMGGAGIQAARMLAERKVDVLLTGSCGPNASAVLNAAGIRIGEVPAGGYVKEVLASFNRGEIASLNESGSDASAGVPTRGGGRGMGGGGRGMGGGGRG